MSSRLLDRPVLRLLFSAIALLIVTARAALAEPEIAPLVLTPNAEGAALASTLGPLEARLRLADSDNRRLLGGSTGVDFGRVQVKAAYDGDLARLFGASGAWHASGSKALAGLFAQSRSLGLSTDVGPASLALAAGGTPETGRVLGTELQVTRAPAELALQLGGSTMGRRLFGAGTGFDAAPRLRVELSGRLDVDLAAAESRTKARSGLALQRSDAFGRGDRLRLEVTRNPEGLERLTVGYATPLGPARLQLRSENAPDLADYRARAEWRLEF